MRGQALHRASTDESGFTLLELAVSMIVLAILVAVAIPVFGGARQDATRSHSFASLKNGALAAESWAVFSAGDYQSLTYDELVKEGYQDDPGVRLDVANVGGTGYCLTATNLELPASSEWHVATYDSTEAQPSPADTCPVPRALPLAARGSS